MSTLPTRRLTELLARFRTCRVLVIGDVMLDQFIWGRVSRISPEAPVPVIEFERESFMPGGAANVARNLAALGAPTELFGIVGRDAGAKQLAGLLASQAVNCAGLLPIASRMTTRKARVIAQRQQVVRVDRESRGDLDAASTQRLLATFTPRLKRADAVVVGDYGKGVVTQALLNELTLQCRAHGVWLSLDPKPVHSLDLRDLSLLTPNRKEAFELAGVKESGGTRPANPLEDAELLRVADTLFARLKPALLLITLGEQGLLLCQRSRPPFHVPTAAQEVFDVSGAGDTVIASFTLAIAAGASPVEAAILSNHAAGVVVGKIGTATVAPEELRSSFGSLA
jgi:D-beta-D-heptose 7-phosphate kinase/D-beta-D-heptose 1-phosphate adenosyltransferase